MCFSSSYETKLCIISTVGFHFNEDNLEKRAHVFLFKNVLLTQTPDKGVRITKKRKPGGGGSSQAKKLLNS